MLSLLTDLQQTIERTIIPDVVLEKYLPTWWPVLALLYVAVEIAFYVYFRRVMVPYANKHILPSEYRDYGRQRHKLVLRILERVARTSKVTGKDDLEETAEYLMQWFEYSPGHGLKYSSKVNSGIDRKSVLLQRMSESSMGSTVASSVCSSGPDDSDMEYDVVDDRASDDGSVEEENDGCCEGSNRSKVMSQYADYNAMTGRWTVTILGKDDVDDFMAWGFFGKFVKDLEKWELDEMNQCYKVLEDLHGIVFEPGRSPNHKLRHLLSLEDCVAMHRPLAFYGSVIAMKWCASQLFRLAGYTRHVSSTGVVCWYKPAADDIYSQSLLPLCFFHGVGPGGFAFYTLMVLLGLNRTGRAIFLFENHSVACTLNFKALSEHDTIVGVKEMVDKFCGPGRGISLMGHSFGSSALTWLLHSELKPQIRQMVILEPVSIMLSESDVIRNMAKPLFKMAIDIVLEHYIRRQYPWYNSELWLEDIPEDVQVIIGLAGNDPIISTEKVTQEIKSFCAVNPKIAKNIDFINWKNNLHGMCLALPWCWRDINNAMLKQEQDLMLSSKKQKHL